ncbi:SREBF2 isoform 5 [Pongo abelii]|uniref:SREBF2 isoform 5 n=1 Tax=Pongo abelii TaxID=9601 RepID=A0A2J8TWM5_PONAB|nr:SREBF2 isoform 5 [Pongo abelii]
MLQFVSNQVGEFPDLFSEQLCSSFPGSGGSGSSSSSSGGSSSSSGSNGRGSSSGAVDPSMQRSFTQVTLPSFSPSAASPQAPTLQVKVSPTSVPPTPRATPVLQPRPQPQPQPQAQLQQQTVMITPTFSTAPQTRIIQQPLIYQNAATSFQVLQPQVQSLVTSSQVQPVTIQQQVQTVQAQRVLTQTANGTLQTLAPATVQTVAAPQVQQVPVLVQPQIIKTDSLVLTTLKTDGSPVMAAVQNPALTALTTPIQTAALQVPGDFAAAAANLQTCLAVLGRALPTSRLDLACSLSWNVIRYSLQKLHLVRWLLKKVFQCRRATPATEAGFEDEAKTSARDAALAYHRLHQLHITGKLPAGSACSDVHMALCAVNLAECAEEKIPPSTLVEIHLTAAMGLKTRCGGKLGFLASYFLSRAQSLCGPEHSAVPDSLRWLCHPLGQKFFMERSWSVKSAAKESLYCAQRNPADPIAQVHQAFCKNLLERAIESLVKPQAKKKAGDQEEESCEFSSALEYLKLLHSFVDSVGIVTPPLSSSSVLKSALGPDIICRWWTSAITVAISWLQGDDAAVRSHFTKVESVPKALEVTESPLVKAVFHACRAMHASLPGKADGQQSSFCHCERASGHLWSSLNVSGATSDPVLNHVVQLLTCDLLLSLRTTLWQKQASASQAVGETYHASGAELAGFQRDLGSLRRLAHSFRPAYRKVFLHEATVRLMAGASPTRTHQLLEHSLRRRTTQSTKHGEVDAWPGQRERATAILLACRHLPLSFLSSPGQRAVLLAEAARTLEKVGDRRSCNDCQQMIVKLGGGTAIAAS